MDFVELLNGCSKDPIFIPQYGVTYKLPTTATRCNIPFQKKNNIFLLLPCVHLFFCLSHLLRCPSPWGAAAAPCAAAPPGCLAGKMSHRSFQLPAPAASSAVPRHREVCKAFVSMRAGGAAPNKFISSRSCSAPAPGWVPRPRCHCTRAWWVSGPRYAKHA